jgi:hypothetical protein
MLIVSLNHENLFFQTRPLIRKDMYITISTVHFFLSFFACCCSYGSCLSIYPLCIAFILSYYHTISSRSFSRPFYQVPKCTLLLVDSRGM